MFEMPRTWPRMFPGFRLRLTWWGGLFLVLTLVLAFAAVNSGNNGLMTVLGGALGTYIVGGIWSREVLGHVQVTVKGPAETFARRTSLYEVELVNTSGFFPAYGLVLRSGDQTVLAAQGFLGPGERVRRTVRWCFGRRGWRPFASWRLEVVLPLGFFVKSKEVLAEQRVLVFPEPVHGPSGSRWSDEGARGFERYVGRGREGDVFQLRDFHEGDDTRQIHWKQTARQRRMISVDRRRSVDHPVVLHLDPVVDGPDRREAFEHFEHRVSAVAGAVLARLERGSPVVLSVGEDVFPVEFRRSGARRLLEPLAVVQPVWQGER